MDNERQAITPRIFPRPTNDELIRVMIEIFLVKRRGIHRIEELLDPVDKNLDPLRSAVMTLTG